MTTSFIIPCDGQHFPHLFSLLEHIQNQTEIPDEVIISISRVESIQEESISSLKNHPWPFSLQILEHHGKKSAGENRNLASLRSSGDILICQDADDLPHPQRVEIVKYMFQTYNIDHLIHFFISPSKAFMSYKAEEIPIHQFFSIQERNEYCVQNSIINITNGNICFTREISKNISWKHSEIGEDTNFNECIYASSYRSILISADLIMYRQHLSIHTSGL